jgi:hypothetical protein
MKDESPRGSASLPSSPCTGKDCGPNNHFQIGIIRNNNRIVPTQLEQRLSESGLNFDADLK